jgi:translation elongation factor P/translation initiation factor 5A
MWGEINCTGQCFLLDCTAHCATFNQAHREWVAGSQPENAKEGKMGKAMKKVTESKLERMVRQQQVQVEEREGDFVVLMDCETFATWVVRVVH